MKLVPKSQSKVMIKGSNIEGKEMRSKDVKKVKMGKTLKATKPAAKQIVITRKHMQKTKENNRARLQAIGGVEK